MVLGICLPAFSSRAQKIAPVWKDGDGNAKTQAELDKVLDAHKLWVESKQKQGEQADFSDADLHGLDFSEMELTGANFKKANLEGASFREARLDQADLTEANLEEADLQGTSLVKAHLSADLTEADLRLANLDGAKLSEGLAFTFDSQIGVFKPHTLSADLQEAIYEPVSNPDVANIAGARNLDLITYRDNTNALTQLRKLLEDGGYRTQARKITYALKRKEAEDDWDHCSSRYRRGTDELAPIAWSSDSVLANCGSFVFNRVFFDLTCQYGMNPGRALQIWLVAAIVCWLVYVMFIHLPGPSGIYRVQSGPEGEEQIKPRRLAPAPRWRYPIRVLEREARVLFWAGFFSLMSAFNIGFREINFGRWLRLLTRTEYDLKARGWARTVAGVQSLISVFLIALWLLTYFGHPFDF